MNTIQARYERLMAKLGPRPVVIRETCPQRRKRQLLELEGQEGNAHSADKRATIPAKRKAKAAALNRLYLCMRGRSKDVKIRKLYSWLIHKKGHSQ